MVALPNLDKSRCRYHLAYGAGVPAGDRARLEEAFNDIEDNFTLNKIKEQLDRCDRAEATSELGNAGFSSRELITGDINRSVIRTSNTDAFRIWKENYLNETDRLAHILWVPNYRRESALRYRYARHGAEYIKAVPGPADTSVGTQIYLAEQFI